MPIYHYSSARRQLTWCREPLSRGRGCKGMSRPCCIFQIWNKTIFTTVSVLVTMRRDGARHNIRADRLVWMLLPPSQATQFVMQKPSESPATKTICGQQNKTRVCLFSTNCVLWSHTAVMNPFVSSITCFWSNSPKWRTNNNQHWSFIDKFLLIWTSSICGSILSVVMTTRTCWKTCKRLCATCACFSSGQFAGSSGVHGWRYRK